MKAIRTRYSGPTDTRGARIHATDGDGNRVSISYPYGLDHNDDHRLAAYTLMEKMGWPNVLVGGCFGRAFYWVMMHHESGQQPMHELVLPALREKA